MTRKMKDSGIEWIGEIPEEWEVAKIKYYCDSIYSGGTPSRLEPKYWNGDINWIPSGYCKNKEIIKAKEKITKEALLSSSTKLINKGTPLVAMTGATCGFTGYLKIDACINQSIMAYIPNKLTNSRFLWYLTLSLYEKYLSLQSGGAQAGINSIDAKNIYVPYVKIKEQNNIAKILDKKTGQIESIKSIIAKEIQTLEDYKKSIITEAVTKGLDKNVEMKDSGIEWIGEIPKHWEVSKIKYNMQRKEEKNPGNKQVLSVYREYGVIPKDSRDDNHNKTSLDTSNYKYVRPGYLVINKMKAWQGSMGVSQHEGIVSPAYYIYVFTNKSILPFYIHNLLRLVYPEEFKRISGGIREGQWDLSAQLFEDTLIILPPLDEQEKIIKYITKEFLTINRLITSKEKQLFVLEEYKKSLIYEYVTGKKEVE